MAKTIKELTQDLLQAPSACKEVKEAAQNYLDAAGTEKEADAATAYVKELEADIMPIDGLISFAGSDMGAQVFGADDAKKILAHAEEIKASGAKSTDPQSPESAEHLCGKTKAYAEAWAPRAEKLWKERQEEIAEKKAAQNK